MTKTVEGSKPRETVPAPKSAANEDENARRRALEDAERQKKRDADRAAQERGAHAEAEGISHAL